MIKYIFICFLFLFNMNFWNCMYLLMFLFYIKIVFLCPTFNIIFFNSFLFCDNLNYWLIILTLWIMFLMIMSIYLFKINMMSLKFMIFIIMILYIFLFLSFFVHNILLFYVFFEMSLIPTLYLILGWGYQPERIQAAIYLLFYTLFASMPLLLSILYIKLNFYIYEFFNLNIQFNLNYLYFSLILAFLVKMPMFLVHLWLPKAHVEAPICGSMILAAILLKLGGYGMLRIMMFLVKFNNFNLLFMLISIIGGSLISFNSLRQLDMKMLIAYSSVAHMGLVLSGIFVMSIWGINGSFLMMIAHGLCSSGLFCLANISYERVMSRSMLINKGLMNFMPSLAVWWFLLIINNMSSPMSLNLLSEISLINSVISYSYFNYILIFILCFFSACYCYYIYSFTQHGMFYMSIFSFSNISIRESILLFFHWIPLNILFLKIILI